MLLKKKACFRKAGGVIPEFRSQESRGGVRLDSRLQTAGMTYEIKQLLKGPNNYLWYTTMCTTLASSCYFTDNIK